MAQKVRLGGELDPRTVEGIAADAKTIIDRKNGNKRQDDMNAELADAIAAKQDKLVSGTNIKTINSQSILGSGNIDIQGGGASQVQSDWNQSDNSQPDFIKNKPIIPDISGKADKSEMSVTPGTGANADKTTIQLKQGTSATVLTQHQDISGKQDVINDLPTIRSGAAAGATAQQPATTLAGYGITDGATKTELQELESEVDSKLEEQDDAIARLNGNDVVVVDSFDDVTTPDTQKIYRVPNHTEEIDVQGDNNALISSDYYSYIALTLENNTKYVALDGCTFINLQTSTIIGTTVTTTIVSGEQYAIAKQVAGSTDVADLSYTKTNNDIEPTFYTDYMCVDDTTTPVTWKKIGIYTFPGIDNKPTEGSNNLVKSGGVYDTITKHVGNVIDISSIINNPILYDSVTNWTINNASYQGKWFKIVKGCNYLITPKSGSNALYSLLKSMDTSGAPDYADGTSRNSVNVATIVTPPADANFIWIGTKVSGTDITPSVEVIGKVYKSIGDIETEIRNTNLIFEGINAMPSYSGWLDGNSASIVTYGSSKFVIVPVKGRKILHITTGSSYCNLFLAKNYKTSPLPIIIELATGETGRRSINGSTDTTINLPIDVEYLYLQLVDNLGNNIRPLYLSVDGIKVVDVNNHDALNVEDKVVIGSDKLITSGAVFDSIAENAGMNIAVENIQNSPILYDDNGTWIVDNGNYQGRYFSCIPGAQYKFTPALGAPNVLVSFLKTLDTDAPNYAAGTSRNAYTAETIVTVPSDANYIWVLTKYVDVLIPTVSVCGRVDNTIKDIYNKMDELVAVTSGIDKFPYYSGWLDGGEAKIVNYSVSKFIVIPVDGRKKLRIIANSIKPTLMFIAKNLGTSLPIMLELASGETGRRSFSTNSDTTINIPSDAKYIYLQAIYFNGDNAIPAYLSIDNLQIIPKKVEDFTKIEDEKKNLLSALTSPVAHTQSSNILNFIHTSDTHLRNGNEKQFANIISLLNEDYINCLIHTGDIVWDNFPYNGDLSAEGLNIFNNLMQSVSKDVIISVGNHDVGGEYKDVATSGTDKQIYDTFYSPLMKNNFVSGGTDKSYFYVDYSQGVRIISLYQYNSDFELDPNDDTKLKDIRGRIAYRQDEIDWLCGVLNSTPEGYAVLLLTHQPESLGSKTNSWQSRIFVNSNWSDFLSNIVNAYVNRQVVNASIEQTVGVVGTITANYDFSNAKGYFAGFVNGHTHDDFIGKEYHYDLNVLNKCCDNKLYQSGCSINHIDNTPSENTINVVSINTQNRTITVFRIGGKYTADGDYRDVITLSY